jgi:hypothetical protein
MRINATFAQQQIALQYVVVSLFFQLALMARDA